MSIETQQLKNVIQAAMMSFGQPLTVDRMLALFDEDAGVSKSHIREVLGMLQEECTDTGVELVEVGSGFRYQARQESAPWVARLWEEKPPRYSRALLETLVLIAYRQPITRGEIESIRGVSVSSHIVKTLLERDWVKVVGHRDVPGRPAIYATTKAFLDYFNLKSLEQLPTLSEIRDLDKISAEIAGSTEVIGESTEAAGEGIEAAADASQAESTQTAEGFIEAETSNATGEESQNANTEQTEAAVAEIISEEQDFDESNSIEDSASVTRPVEASSAEASSVEASPVEASSVEASSVEASSATETDEEHTLVASDDAESVETINAESDADQTALIEADADEDEMIILGPDLDTADTEFSEDDSKSLDQDEQDFVIDMHADEEAESEGVTPQESDVDDDYVDFSLSSDSDVEADDYDPEAEVSSDRDFTPAPTTDFEEMYRDPSEDESHQKKDTELNDLLASEDFEDREIELEKQAAGE